MIKWVFKHGLLAPGHLDARLLLLLARVAPAELVVDQHAVGQRRLGEETHDLFCLLGTSITSGLLFNRIDAASGSI